MRFIPKPTEIHTQTHYRATQPTHQIQPTHNEPRLPTSSHDHLTHGEPRLPMRFIPKPTTEPPSQPIKSNWPNTSQDYPWRATTTPPTATHAEPRPPHPRRATTTHKQTSDHGDLNPTYPKPPRWSVPCRSEEERRECGRKRETLKVRGRERVRLKNNLGVLNFLFLFLFFWVFIFISVFFLFFSFS